MTGNIYNKKLLSPFQQHITKQNNNKKDFSPTEEKKCVLKLFVFAESHPFVNGVIPCHIRVCIFVLTEQVCNCVKQFLLCSVKCIIDSGNEQLFVHLLVHSSAKYNDSILPHFVNRYIENNLITAK